MTRKLKNIGITLFSIFAMLMSTYASSSPYMLFGSSFQTSSVVSTDVSHANLELANSNHSDHIPVRYSSDAVDCHSLVKSSLLEEESSNALEHCGDSTGGIDNCCTQICSSASYPTDSGRDLSASSSSLALYHSDKIGVTVARIQSLLRPPSI